MGGLRGRLRKSGEGGNGGRRRGRRWEKDDQRQHGVLASFVHVFEVEQRNLTMKDNDTVQREASSLVARRMLLILNCSEFEAHLTR